MLGFPGLFLGPFLEGLVAGRVLALVGQLFLERIHPSVHALAIFAVAVDLGACVLDHVHQRIHLLVGVADFLILESFGHWNSPVQGSAPRVKARISKSFIRVPPYSLLKARQAGE